MADRTTGITPTFPDAAAQKIGTPPVNRTGGERGTSAFPGNTDYDAKGVLKANTIPAEGPLRGTQYYNDPGKKSSGIGAQTQGTHTKTAQSPS